MLPELKVWLEGATRVVILGVGSRIRRDDSIGLVLIDRLRGRVPGLVELLDCETVPESFTGPIRKLAPSHLLIIDAAELGLNPGEVRIINPESIVEARFSTHALSLSILSEYITSETGARVLLIGVQPKDLQFGVEMTPELTHAAECLSQFILSVLSEALET